MTPTERAAILLRDGQCIAALLDRSHDCRDRWGELHAPTDLDRLTIDHVRREAGGFRDDAWTVAMCHDANIRHWSAVTENRRLANAYLQGIVR